MTKSSCQIHSLPKLPESAHLADRAKTLISRGKRFLKRRWRYLLKAIRDSGRPRAVPSPGTEIRAGDFVYIRPRHEIMKTLNRWHQLRGCAFMEEMWPYCGTRQRVLKEVKTFLDERDYTIKKCAGIFILDGLTCQGTRDFGGCDRSCFFFWRKEWLDRELSN